MSDLEFLKLYHNADEDTKTFVDAVLGQGQLSRDLQEKHYGNGQVNHDPHHLCSQDYSH
jgi:hypothetical protein